MNHLLLVTPLAHADETNHPHRVRCVAGPCEQLATILWHFRHDDGSSSDNVLCPTHAAQWMADYATPDSEYWLGR